VATEAAWLKGTIWKKKEEKERRKREKNERNGLTLTGLLMEGPSPVRAYTHNAHGI
jgi:hypothetical protein